MSEFKSHTIVLDILLMYSMSYSRRNNVQKDDERR